MSPWWLRPTAEAEGTEEGNDNDSSAAGAAEEPARPEEAGEDEEAPRPRRSGRSGRRRSEPAAETAPETEAPSEGSKPAPTEEPPAKAASAQPQKRSQAPARRGRGRGGSGGRGETGKSNGKGDGRPAQEKREARREPPAERPAPERGRAESRATREREQVRPGEQLVVPLTQLEDLTREIVISVPERSADASLDRKLALFCDLENVALGARETGVKFDINKVLERVVEKGKIIVKRAYADWERYSDYKRAFHESGIELIDIPQKRYSGKNSADIKMVVDAMDLCYAKEHLDTFVLLSGDSDFSPLVSKLKENNKYVIGVGVKGSSSNLLIDNCDEFIYYEDIWRDVESTPKLDDLGKKEKEVFGLLIDSILALNRENKDVLWGSMIKQTMLRKRPSFNEGYYGYSTFSDLLEDAQEKNVVKLKKDQRSGSYIITGFARRRR